MAMLSTPVIQLLHVKHALIYLPIHVFRDAGNMAMLSTPDTRLCHDEFVCVSKYVVQSGSKSRKKITGYTTMLIVLYGVYSSNTMEYSMPSRDGRFSKIKNCHFATVF